jgi:hypothetical protein
MSTIEELTARLTRMERALEEVQARLDASEGRRRGLMREARCCPACGQTAIYHLTELASGLPGQRSVVAAHISTKSPVFLTPSRLRSLYEGVLEAFVCGACGHCELQLNGIAALEDQENVRRLEAPPQQEGPYRTRG